MAVQAVHDCVPIVWPWPRYTSSPSRRARCCAYSDGTTPARTSAAVLERVRRRGCRERWP
eukprot:scaffold270219_cov40-Tisochrysis_lutea.AAC.2